MGLQQLLLGAVLVTPTSRARGRWLTPAKRQLSARQVPHSVRVNPVLVLFPLFERDHSRHSYFKYKCDLYFKYALSFWLGEYFRPSLPSR